ncbi:MAG: WD40 repeat domain-containing protein [Anaerolineae bacterium]|nr:WD40 repeat domain-containing protein [Anaerolineae bacterium]
MSSQTPLRNLALTLKQVLTRHGEIWKDTPTQLGLLLASYAREQALERRLVMLALNEKVPHALRQLQGRGLDKAILHQLASRLTAKQVPSREAQYAVIVWAMALGIPLDSTLTGSAMPAVASTKGAPIATVSARLSPQHEAYANILRLAGSEETRHEAKRAFVAFQKQFSDWRDYDTDHLAVRFLEPVQMLFGYRPKRGALAWSPNGRYLASAYDDNTCRLWDTDSRRLARMRIIEKHDFAINAVAWSPDGQKLACAVNYEHIKIWSLQDQKHETKQNNVSTLLVFSELGHKPSRPTLLAGAKNGLCVAWSLDGRYLVFGTHDGTIILWDVAHSKVLQSLKKHSGAVYSVALSPDGRYLASGSADQTIRLWASAQSEHSRVLVGHTGEVYCVAWSPNGHYLASASADQTIRLWESSSGQPMRTLKGHTDAVHCVAWSPDGRYLASASSDQSVRVWDAANGQCLRTLRWHKDSVNAVAWSPDGRYLASGARDARIIIWGIPEQPSDILNVDKSLKVR